MLLQAAAQNVLRTSMELGGNAPFVVFEDADLEKAVKGRTARQVPQHRPGMHRCESHHRARVGG